MKEEKYNENVNDNITYDVNNVQKKNKDTVGNIISIIAILIFVFGFGIIFVPRIIRSAQGYHPEDDHILVSMYAPGRQCKEIYGSYNEEDVIDSDFETKIIKGEKTYRAYTMANNKLFELDIPASDETVTPLRASGRGYGDSIVGLSTKNGFYKLSNCKYYFTNKGYAKFNLLYGHDRMLFINKDNNHILMGYINWGDEESITFDDEIDSKLGKVTDIKGEYLDNNSGIIKVTVTTEGSLDGLDSHWFIYVINPRENNFNGLGYKVISYDDNAEYYVEGNAIHIKMDNECYSYDRFEGKEEDYNCSYYKSNQSKFKSTKENN